MYLQYEVRTVIEITLQKENDIIPETRLKGKWSYINVSRRCYFRAV